MCIYTHKICIIVCLGEIVISKNFCITLMIKVELILILYNIFLMIDDLGHFCKLTSPVLCTDMILTSILLITNIVISKLF